MPHFQTLLQPRWRLPKFLHIAHYTLLTFLYNLQLVSGQYIKRSWRRQNYKFSNILPKCRQIPHFQTPLQPRWMLPKFSHIAHYTLLTFLDNLQLVLGRYLKRSRRRQSYKFTKTLSVTSDGLTHVRIFYSNISITIKNTYVRACLRPSNLVKFSKLIILSPPRPLELAT